MTTYVAGDCGHRVEIEDGWRVLDVGSGQSPHPRADVLLERFSTDNRHRSGDAIDTSDPRLVIGDACAMPFRDGEFDYVIASHVAEHVDDPIALCRELCRVARAGYLETPGWLGDMLLREEFHIWRVSRAGRGLRFDRVRSPRPLGWLGDVFYALVYATVPRDGHWTPRSSNRLIRRVLAVLRRVMSSLIVSRPLRGLLYLTFEWRDCFPAVARDRG